jgi:hypothetical protein
LVIPSSPLPFETSSSNSIFLIISLLTLIDCRIDVVLRGQEGRIESSCECRNLLTYLFKNKDALSLSLSTTLLLWFKGGMSGQNFLPKSFFIKAVSFIYTLPYNVTMRPWRYVRLQQNEVTVACIRCACSNVITYVMHVFTGAEETGQKGLALASIFVCGYCTHVKSIGSNILFW